MRNVNYCYLGIKILSFSVVIIKKINLSRLHTDGKFRNFSEAATDIHSHNIHRKVASLQCNFTKKRLQHRCFPLNIAKFLRTPVLKNIC